MAFIVSVCAVPITPSAPELQRRAEQYRLQGLQEHEIAEKLTLPITTSADESVFSHLSTRMYALLHGCVQASHNHDVSGDIAPGSLEAPQMLPRPALLKPTALDKIITFLKKEDAEKNFAYEGKELELRRPTGMRHWGAQDKWRLF
ncbi:hypothetical protein N0V90_006212 [Kalmusia sp. IMI 367209]|nr:hypothetical protein N0V90_006212 [Kalmusia sp. IMI 367209]